MRDVVEEANTYANIDEVEDLTMTVHGDSWKRKEVPNVALWNRHGMKDFLVTNAIHRRDKSNTVANACQHFERASHC